MVDADKLQLHRDEGYTKTSSFVSVCGTLPLWNQSENAVGGTFDRVHVKGIFIKNLIIILLTIGLLKKVLDQAISQMENQKSTATLKSRAKQKSIAEHQGEAAEEVTVGNKTGQMIINRPD